MGMGLITGISLALLGVLAVPNLLLSKKPEAQATLDKIAPYQGWIGALCAVWGAYGLIYFLFHLSVIRHSLVLAITVLATCGLQFALGMILGIGVLKQFIKSPAAQQKMDGLVVTLSAKKGGLGLAAVCLGAWCVIAGLIY